MSSKVTDKIGRENQGGSRVADTMKMAWNVGSVKTRKECWGEVKNFLKKLLLGVIDMQPAGLIGTFRMGLRSSSCLRVVATQAIYIFIRGCYL